MSEIEQAAFVARLRAGEERAFERLYRELGPPLRGLCLHLTGEAADAEDALQEVFIAVHKGIRGFRGRSKLRTWIYRIALRTANRVRARERKPRQRPLTGEETAASPSEPGELAEVLAALDRLPQDQRAVLSLFALEGHSQAMIAEVLGIPVGTVWSRLHNARKALLARLKRREDRAQAQGSPRAY